ncbi:MAG: NAD-dependent DNA ligase LigA, partial [bacterium]
MNKNEAQKRAGKLRKIIERYAYAYHVLDAPEVTDAVFDSLKNELEELERKFPELVTSDSPTQRVSGQPLAKFEKVTHATPMLSLFDAFSEEELHDWEERIQKLVPHKKLDYFSELKIDGLAISLIYKNGIFERGATRGDGRVGEDVTQNLRTIGAIPRRLRVSQKGIVEIRGEAFMKKEDLAEINQQRKKQKLPLYANTRNLTAGSIRQLDPKITANRHLDFFAYALPTDLG